MEHCQQEWPLRQKPKEEPKSYASSVSSGEVAPAYATNQLYRIYRNKYYATRARLSYHPPDKQYKGEPTVQASTSRPSQNHNTLTKKPQVHNKNQNHPHLHGKQKVHRQQRNML